MSYPISRLFSKFCIGFLTFLFTLNAKADLSDMSRIFRQTLNLAAFEVCYGGGCAEIKKLSLTNEEWQKVSAIFDKAVIDAAQERQLIGKGIAQLEAIVGEKIGTSNDLAGTFYHGPLSGQQDCNDESINSTTYMRLMHLAGLLKWHQIEDTRTRNFFFNGWPHSSAVIRDTSTNTQFAVDSWFYDNGVPPVIVPFKEWKAGYRPVDTPIDHPRPKN